MQQAKPQFGSNRSSGGVLDRVRWIENTHGPSTTAAQQPRARLRLPKQFAEAAAAGPQSPAATVVDSPSPRLENRLSRVVEEAPSPALSEASTAGDVRSPVTAATQLAHEPQVAASPIVQRRQPPADSRPPVVALKPLEPSKPMQPLRAPQAARPAEPALRPIQASSSMPAASHQNHNDDDDDVYLYSRRNSSSSDIEALDPEHVRAADEAESKPAASSSFKKLGGVRSRAPPALSRRYNKSQTNAGSASVHSNNDSDHESVKTPPPQLRASRSLTNVRAEYDDLDEPSSLLSRLVQRTSNRPNVQDLVSNRSAPKFVKRSHHYNASPFRNDSPAPNFTSAWGRSQRRYK